MNEWEPPVETWKREREEHKHFVIRAWTIAIAVPAIFWTLIYLWVRG